MRRQSEHGELGADDWRRLVDHAWERHAPDAHTRGQMGSKLTAGTTRDHFEVTLMKIVARDRISPPVGPPDEALRSRLAAGEVALVERQQQHVNLFALSGGVRYEIRLAGTRSTARPIDGVGIIRHIEKNGETIEQDLSLEKRPVQGWDRPKQ